MIGVLVGLSGAVTIHSSLAFVPAAGQLGRMMVYAAHRLGVRMCILDPLGESSPAGQATAETFETSRHKHLDEQKANKPWAVWACAHVVRSTGTLVDLEQLLVA